MEMGMPCSRTTSWKNNLATCTASEVFRYRIKCTILENQSTITNTNTQLCPSKTEHEIHTQALPNIFGCWQWHIHSCVLTLTLHHLTYRNFACGCHIPLLVEASNTSHVLSHPKCPLNPPPCRSQITFCTKTFLEWKAGSLEQITV